jgi:AcrR family transcriptional regulator
MSPVDNGPPRRADARRNRDALLAAAAAVIAEEGPDAPLDRIARRAGIGNATLYRHFPTRRDLLVAVTAGEIDALCARGAALRAERSPGDALFGWLALLCAHTADYRELATALAGDGLGEGSAEFAGWHARLAGTLSELLTAATAAGAVRADTTVADLLALTSGVALAGRDGVDRLLAVVRRGVTPRAGG